MKVKGLLNHILLAGVLSVSGAAMAGSSAQYDQGAVSCCLASEWVAPEAQKKASEVQSRQVGVQQAAMSSPQHDEGAVSCCLANEWVLEDSSR
jgi:hypothetical protein